MNANQIAAELYIALQQSFSKSEDMRHIKAAIEKATEELREASFNDVASNLSGMITEYVENGIKLGTDWRKGLPEIVARRLKRIQMRCDTRAAHASEPPTSYAANPEEDDLDPWKYEDTKRLDWLMTHCGPNFLYATREVIDASMRKEA